MLFHAPSFLFVFLPVTLAGFFALGAIGRERWAIGWLVGASLVFYANWRLADLFVLLGSLAFNYVLALHVARTGSRACLVVGLAANLGVLIWFKYLAFIANEVAQAAGLAWTVGAVVLPLGISFFTFQKIAYLVDAADGVSHERDPLKFALFVVFFPQLIAGPIVHHKEMIPQFGDPATFRPRASNFAVGLTIFAIGLFKKVVLADGVAGPVADAFGAAAEGVPLTLLEAWAAAVAFAFQIYFDFSGYSDMAVGLGRLFGIRLPVNFASPYKAPSIIEFWARWHVTLTRFLTAYVYNPVSMALTRRRMRAGLPRLSRGTPTPGTFLVLLAAPTVLTMGLAGVWHGAGWQFIVFGLLHGGYLVVNHAWRVARVPLGLTPRDGWSGGRWSKPLGVAVTFVCVTVGLVFFRANDVPHALSVLSGMAGLNGFAVPPQTFALFGLDAPDWLPVAHTEHFGGRLALWLLTLGTIVWALPNTQQFIGTHGYGLGPEPARTDPGRTEPVSTDPGRAGVEPAAPAVLRWRPGLAQGTALGMLFCFALLQATSAAPKAFLYFNF